MDRMTRPSTWHRLEISLRRLKRFRELDAPEQHIKSEIDFAKRLWSNVPAPPAGMQTVWHDDIRPLAEELGFDPDLRDRPPMPPQVAAAIGNATTAYRVVAAIDREITAAGGIDDLKVLAARGGITLVGIAASRATRDRAGDIAARVASTFDDASVIDNRITVR